MYYVEIYCYKNCSTVKLYKTQKMAANQVNLDQGAFYRGYLGTKSSMYYVEIYCYKNCSTVKLYKTQKNGSESGKFHETYLIFYLKFLQFLISKIFFSII